MEKLDMIKIQNTWLNDIIFRIHEITKNKKYSDEEKVIAIAWLAKQAVKADID
jgi:hypothetical protein